MAVSHGRFIPHATDTLGGSCPIPYIFIAMRDGPLCPAISADGAVSTESYVAGHLRGSVAFTSSCAASNTLPPLFLITSSHNMTRAAGLCVMEVCRGMYVRGFLWW